MSQIRKRIPILTQKYKLTKQDLELLPSIIEPDPTPGKYSEWLIKNYKTGTTRVPEDNEKLKNNLTTFEKKKSKLQNKDINSYTPGSLAKALDEAFGLTKSERKGARKGSLQLPPGARIIFEEGDLTVVEITTPEASSILCSGTEWCVANKEQAQSYLKKGTLYLLYVNVVRKYLVHYESKQFKDVYDEEADIKIRYEYLLLMKPLLSKFYTSWWALDYARFVIKGRWSEAEPTIMKDPERAYYYAHDLIKGWWPEAEPTIMKDPEWAYYYAMNVIKGRWPEAEPTIMKDPEWAHYYALHIIKGRWPEAEPTIMKDPKSVYYALSIIEGRWPEAEPTIIKDPKWAFDYARDVIMGRWSEAEPTIMKDPHCAYAYALRVIEGRWLAAEPTIMKDPEWAYYYARDVIRGRWQEAEPKIMKDPYWAFKYAHYVIKDRWPEAEPAIMTNPYSACYYAHYIIKGRWQEAEPYIMEDPIWSFYKDLLLSQGVDL